jgi:hypothetical protein
MGGKSVTRTSSLCSFKRKIIITLVSLILFLAFFINSAYADEGGNENNGYEIVLNKYYFGKDEFNTTWLMPAPPGDGRYNFTEVTPEDELAVSQGIIDREYDPDITPQVNLFVNTYGKAGMVINIQMEFMYFNENNILLEDEPVIAYFEPYTTTGRVSHPEEIRSASTSYSGTPQDVPTSDYGAIISVFISLDDTGIDNASFDVYCGKNGYRSNVITPYAEPFIPEDTSDSSGYFAGMERGCYVTAGIIVFVLVAIVLGLHYRDWKNKRD